MKVYQIYGRKHSGGANVVIVESRIPDKISESQQTSERINNMRDYQNVIKGIAANVVAIALEEDESLIEDGCIDEIALIDYINDSDLVHEQVDSSQYTIYNAYHLDILKYSDNDNALINELGTSALDGVESFNDVMGRFAYWALYNDVWNFLHDKLASVMPEGVELI